MADNTMTHSFAALIAGVPRYECWELDPEAMQKNDNGDWVRMHDILSALEATPVPDLVEAGKIEAQLRAKTRRVLPTNWKEGRKCPECDANAERQKCMWEMGGSCPRHDPENYEPSPYEVVPDKQAIADADTIRALIAQNTAQAAQIAGLERERDQYKMACDSQGKVVVDVAGTMERISPAQIEAMSAILLNPMIVAAEGEAATLRDEVERLRGALRPFDACMFNDNGDVTISTGNLSRKDWLNLRAALEGK